MKIHISITDEKGNFYEGNTILQKIKKRKQKKPVQSFNVRKSPAKIIFDLFQEGFFSEEKNFPDVEKKLKQLGYNFGKSSIEMPLKRADYLKQKGSAGKYKYIQKYPP